MEITLAPFWSADIMEIEILTESFGIGQDYYVLMITFMGSTASPIFSLLSSSGIRL